MPKPVISPLAALLSSLMGSTTVLAGMDILFVLSHPQHYSYPSFSHFIEFQYTYTMWFIVLAISLANLTPMDMLPSVFRLPARDTEFLSDLASPATSFVTTGSWALIPAKRLLQGQSAFKSTPSATHNT